MIFPKISIIIPSLNKVDYIEETLKSILDQKYENLEVIVQDGGSTDGTLEIIKKYAKKYPEILQWESKKDKGQADAINKGLKKASGEVLAFINADDVYEEGALKKVGKYFSDNPGTLWLAGKGRVIDKNGKEITKWVTAYKNFLLKINLYSSLLIVNYLMQPSVFLSKKAYEKYGDFEGSKGNVMEYDLWLKIGKDTMPEVVNPYLSGFRLTNDTISATMFRKLLADDYKVAKTHTRNPFLLFLHNFHNLARALVVKSIYLL